MGPEDAGVALVVIIRLYVLGAWFWWLLIPFLSGSESRIYRDYARRELCSLVAALNDFRKV